jgi:hypothetical protein
VCEKNVLLPGRERCEAERKEKKKEKNRNFFFFAHGGDYVKKKQHMESLIQCNWRKNNFYFHDRIKC